MRYFTQKVRGGVWVGQAVGDNQPTGTIVKNKVEAINLIKAWKQEQELGIK